MIIWMSVAIVIIIAFTVRFFLVIPTFYISSKKDGVCTESRWGIISTKDYAPSGNYIVYLVLLWNEFRELLSELRRHVFTFN